MPDAFEAIQDRKLAMSISQTVEEVGNNSCRSWFRDIVNWKFEGFGKLRDDFQRQMQPKLCGRRDIQFSVRAKHL
jgi:hypothetical protein